MTDEYGSDFITITDEDGVEYELEVLAELEYQGKTYLAVVPAAEQEDEELEVSLCARMRKMASRSSAPLPTMRSWRRSIS